MSRLSIGCDCRLWAIGCRLLAFGFWLLAICYWFTVDSFATRYSVLTARYSSVLLVPGAVGVEVAAFHRAAALRGGEHELIRAADDDFIAETKAAADRNPSAVV